MTSSSFELGVRIVIEIFSYRTMHLFGDSYFEQAKLRKRMCVDEQGWDVRHHDGMEFDEYDTPFATYMVYRDKSNIVRGCCRTLPTNQPYMIEQHFSHFLDGPAPKSDKIVELTRLCIDNKISLVERSRAFHEINVAGISHNLSTGIEHVVALTTMDIAKTGLSGKGMRMSLLGQPNDIGGVPHAAIMGEKITPECLSRNFSFGEIKMPVIRYGEERSAA